LTTLMRDCPETLQPEGRHPEPVPVVNKTASARPCTAPSRRTKPPDRPRSHGHSLCGRQIHIHCARRTTAVDDSTTPPTDAASASSIAKEPILSRDAAPPCPATRAQQSSTARHHVKPSSPFFSAARLPPARTPRSPPPPAPALPLHNDNVRGY
jgi:hypothetical protein